MRSVFKGNELHRQGQAVAASRQATEMLNETKNYHIESTNERTRLHLCNSRQRGIGNRKTKWTAHGETSGGHNRPNLVPVITNVEKQNNTPECNVESAMVHALTGQSLRKAAADNRYLLYAKPTIVTLMLQEYKSTGELPSPSVPGYPLDYVSCGGSPGFPAAPRCHDSCGMSYRFATGIPWNNQKMGT